MRKIRSIALGNLSRVKQCLLRKRHKFCYKTELVSLLHKLPVNLYFCMYFSKRMTVFWDVLGIVDFQLTRVHFQQSKAKKPHFEQKPKKRLPLVILNSLPANVSQNTGNLSVLRVFSTPFNEWLLQLSSHGHIKAILIADIACGF